MSFVPREDGTFKLRCSEDGEILTFLHHLRSNPTQHKQTVRLWLGSDNEDYNTLPTSIISFYMLKEMIQLLPKLRELHLRGLVLVRGRDLGHNIDVDGRGSTPAPLAPNLRILSLHRIAIVSPFDIDPLEIVELVPQLRTFTIASCYALPGDGTTDAIGVRETPRFVYPPEPSFPDYVYTLILVFPCRVERELYFMQLPWYDFSHGLPLERGTVRMELRNVHDECSESIRALLDEDRGTLEQLRLEFEPGFQKSSCESWAHVRLDECTVLKKIEFHLPVRFIQDELHSDVITDPLPFATVGLLVRRLPSSVLAIVLELDMLDSYADDRFFALQAIPWAALDERLTSHLPDAKLSIYLATHWPLHMGRTVRAAIQGLMVNSVGRDKVRFKPGRCWPEDI